MLFHEFDEGEQQLAVLMEFESQAAAQVQVFPYGLTQGGHRAPPGHGKASVRKDSRSTLV